MDNTLADGERHLVKITDDINRNDIVVARNDLLDCVIIKRVIAIPGDTIEIKNNVIFLNGNVLEEPYIKEDMITGDITSYTLKENEYFLCGDNRNNSTDSRALGPIHNDDIIGKLLNKGDKNE
jgi:signal peptidase I